MDTLNSLTDIAKMLHMLQGLQEMGTANDGFGFVKQDFVIEDFIENHELHRDSWSRGIGKAKENGIPCFMNSAPSGAALAPSASLSSLREITLPSLVLGKRHEGRVLYGRLCVKPFKMNSVNTVLEDREGRGIRVAIYNVVTSNASTQEIERRFPCGQKIAIKEPFYKLCMDGIVAIRVDNPADIVIDIYSRHDGSSLSGKDIKSVKELEAIRLKGNNCFSKGDYTGAIDKYSACVNLSLRQQPQDVNQQGKSLVLRQRSSNVLPQERPPPDGSISSVLMLAYTNRAECWLRLERYRKAVDDADKALAVNPKHVKSLFRKGKGLRGFGQYEESCKVLVEALKLTPDDQNIRNELKVGTICLHQTQKGIFDLSKFYISGTPSPCCDYIGPVEIKRVSYGNGKRGLFATRDVQPGELLLVSNAVAMKSRSRDNGFSFSLNNLTFHTWGADGMAGHGDILRDLVTEAANAAIGSQRLLAQLYSLATDVDNTKCIPSMELFKPGSQWLPEGAANYQLDIARIEKVCNGNSMTVLGDTLIGITTDDEVPRVTNEDDGYWIDTDNEEDFFTAPSKKVAKEKKAPPKKALDVLAAPPKKAKLSAGRTDKMIYTGLWLLPSFINHSCTPNSQTFNIEKVLFVRAFRPIAAGEEITIPYFNVRNPLGVRDAWVEFTCVCERCKLERGLEKSLKELESKLHNLVREVDKEVDETDGLGRAAVTQLAQMADDINEVIQANEITDPMHQSWIRVSFHHAYLCKYKLAMDVNEATQKIAALKVVVDSLEPVSTGRSTLEFSSMLLKDVENRYFKHSPAYRITEERVLALYRAAYGRECDKSLLQLLIKGNWRRYI